MCEKLVQQKLDELYAALRQDRQEKGCDSMDTITSILGMPEDSYAMFVCIGGGLSDIIVGLAERFAEWQYGARLPEGAAEEIADPIGRQLGNKVREALGMQGDRLEAVLAQLQAANTGSA